MTSFLKAALDAYSPPNYDWAFTGVGTTNLTAIPPVTQIDGTDDAANIVDDATLGRVIEISTAGTYLMTGGLRFTGTLRLDQQISGSSPGIFMLGAQFVRFRHLTGGGTDNEVMGREAMPVVIPAVNELVYFDTYSGHGPKVSLAEFFTCEQGDLLQLQSLVHGSMDYYFTQNLSLAEIAVGVVALEGGAAPSAVTPRLTASPSDVQAVRVARRRP